MKGRQGFTLIEFLCASFLSGLLMMMLTQVFLSVKQFYRLEKAESELQQQAYFLSSYLIPRVMRAGFSPCESGDDFLKPELAVQGYEHDQLPNFITQKDKVRGDVLLIGLCSEFEGRQQFKQFAYYVGETNRRDERGHSVNAFYEKPLSGDRIELEEGVQSLSLKYGVKGGRALVYQSADTIKEWSQVSAVDFHFELASLNALVHSPWNIYVHLRKDA